ncbi:ABC transporter substrate-binding protein [Microbacterium sp.]|uniref:ABC transporter substrate-binding protein n=1 Tax=Microbacterium sp. TaxID=51671 RepID=UPI003F72D9D1
MTNKSSKRARAAHRGIAAAAALSALLVLSACQGAAPAATVDRVDPSGPPPAADLTVWTDAVRQSGFEAYQELYGEDGTDLSIETLPDQFPQKILLATKADKGWPDVVFDGGTNNVNLFSSELYDFAADLTPLLPEGTADEFYEGAISPCVVDGKLYCLRNDYAPNLLWYNTELFDEFGYTVPSTFEEYLELGLTLAEEHPGYSVGAIGGDQGNFFLGSSQCNYGQVVDEEFSIDLTSPECTRAIDFLDQLLAVGAVSPEGEFAPGYTADVGTAGKVLMMVGPTWYGEYLFKGTYQVADGVMGVADPLIWEGDDRAYNQTYGGGVYYVSKHAENPTAAAALALWMATSEDFQVAGPTFPAYQPAATAWLARIKSTGAIATEDIEAVIDAAGKAVDGDQQAALNIPSTIDRGWSSQVVPVITAGDPISSVVDSWQQFIENSAQAAGF